MQINNLKIQITMQKIGRGNGIWYFPMYQSRYSMLELGATEREPTRETMDHSEQNI